MSFFQIAGGALQIGDGASITLDSVIRKLGLLLGANSVSVETAIEILLNDDGDSINDAETVALKALRHWVAKHGSKSLADLLEPLNVLETATDAGRRKIGWPAKEWAVPLGSGANIGPFAFNIDADGGAYFNLLKDNEKPESDVPAFETSNASASMNLSGHVEGAAKGNVQIPIGGIKLGAQGEIGRSLSYHFGFAQQSNLTGLALASALSLVDDPSNGQAVLERFKVENRMARLSAIVLEGKEGLGGELGVSAKFPSAYGTFGVKLEGITKLANDFKIIVTKVDGANRLALKVKTNKDSSHNAEIGVSYSVGLSTISPTAATAILSHVKGLHDLIVRIDEEAEKWAKIVKSWLKPGDLIKEKLLEHLSKELGELKDKTGETPLVLIGRVFNLTDGDLTTDSVIKMASEQIAEITADILDELPELFDLSEDKVRQKIIDAFKDALPAQALAWLDTKIFTKVEKELRDALSDLSARLDETIESRISDFVDNPGGKIDELRDFIGEARKISQKILDGISQAQTDLLAAEIGWHRAKTQNRSIDYNVTLDLNQPENLALYRQVILQPSKFGQILFSDNSQTGINVLQATHLREITKSGGHRWSVALIGMAIGGSVTKRSHVKIVNSLDGVLVATNSEIEKTSKFFKESRRANFLSALQIFEASAARKGGSEPNAAAAIKVHFEEEDDNLYVEEAKHLLSRLKDNHVLTQDVYNTIISDITATRNIVQGKLKAKLSMGLAIPPSQFINTLRAIQNNRPTRAGLISIGATNDFVKDAIIAALSETDAEKIKALGPKPDERSRAMGLSGSFGLTARTKENFNLETVEGRSQLLSQIVSSSTRMGLSNMSTNTLSDFDKDRIEYAETIEAVNALLITAADLYFNDSIVYNSPEELRDLLSDWQDNMDKMASRYLEVGKPIPYKLRLFGRGRMPYKTAGLFRTIQIIANMETGITPPLLLSFKPAKGEAKNYISLATPTPSDR